MIVVCLIRIDMLEASQLAKVSVGQLSFARAFTEMRLFFKLLLSTGEENRWASIWAAFVKCCGRYRVKCEDQAKPILSRGSAEVSNKEPRVGAEASGT